jgi:uroporphyrinogen-III synthase
MFIIWLRHRTTLLFTITAITKPVTSFSRIGIHSRTPTKICNRHSQATPDLDMTEGGSVVSSQVIIALTRERGKNEKLRKALLSNERIARISQESGLTIQIYELPCIEHADGPDIDKLAPLLASSLNTFDYVAITSPEAASVFANAWIKAERPRLGTVAAVGKATQEALVEFDIEVGFVPSKATASTLVDELPLSNEANNEGRATTVLYPASTKAQDTLQSGLEERGFSVLRLNTYDTITASWTPDQISIAQSTNNLVVCFASPSAVKSWLINTASFDNPRPMASCIGETSATACRNNEWEENNIFFPDKPGIDGWATAVADALELVASTNLMYNENGAL